MSIIAEGRKLYESGQIEEIKKETMNLLEDFIGTLTITQLVETGACYVNKKN